MNKGSDINTHYFECPCGFEVNRTCPKEVAMKRRFHLKKCEKGRLAIEEKGLTFTYTAMKEKQTGVEKKVAVIPNDRISALKGCAVKTVQKSLKTMMKGKGGFLFPNGEIVFPPPLNADEKEVKGVCDECGIEGKYIRTIDKDGNFSDDDEDWTCCECSGE